MLFWTDLHAIKTLFPFLLFCFFIAFPAVAQDNPMLYKKIQLSKKTYTFDELTHQIQKQTGITFSYNASKINPNQRFKIKPGQMNAIQLLSVIKKESGIGYKMINPGYIVYEAPAKGKASNKQKKKVTKKTTEHIAKKEERRDEVTPETAVPTAANPLEADSTAPQEVVVIGDSVTVSNYYSAGNAGGQGGGNKTVQIVMRYPRGYDSARVDAYSGLNPPVEKNYFQLSSFDNPDISAFVEKNILIAGGISANETHYLNPGLYFGFRFLYAALSYNWGNFSEWRYGIGTEVPISEKWFLQAELSTGRGVFKDFSYPTFDTTFFPPLDSIPPVVTQIDVPFNTASKLSSFSISVARSLSQRLVLSGGITINQLKSTYFSEGAPFDINSIDPAIPDATNLYQTVEPPYVLSQSYNASDAVGLKYWLGLRLSICWRLN